MSKKKKIIISLIEALAVIAIILVLLNEWGNREHEKMLEATKLEQELEEKALKEQQEQEEKERQERLAKLEEGWNALGENQEYLALGSTHLKRTIEGDYHIFNYDIDFIDSLYMINDGWFQGISREDLGSILAVALVDLPDNATGRQVYDALCNYCENNNRSEVVTGQGVDVLEGLVKNDSSPTSNNQTSNSNGNNSTSNSNKNASSNNTSSNERQEETNAPQPEDWEVSEGPTTSDTNEDPDRNPFDASGWDMGTAGWHEYWDGKTVKEYGEQGGFHSLYCVVEQGQGNQLGRVINYPDDYVIGSYGIIYYNFYGEGQHLYGKY